VGFFCGGFCSSGDARQFVADSLSCAVAANLIAAAEGSSGASSFGRSGKECDLLVFKIPGRHTVSDFRGIAIPARSTQTLQRAQALGQLPGDGRSVAANLSVVGVCPLLCPIEQPPKIKSSLEPWVPYGTMIRSQAGGRISLRLFTLQRPSGRGTTFEVKLFKQIITSVIAQAPRCLVDSIGG
jgi:hypothetical protein